MQKGQNIADRIRQNECTTKQGVLDKIQRKEQKYASEAKKMPESESAYKVFVTVYLAALYERVRAAVLFEELPDYWIYELRYEYDEFSLSLLHVKEYELDENDTFKSMRPDAIYKLISVRPETFSVEQYASTYGVEQGTIRQWIRRGKIRTAYKQDGEWKIPMLSPPPSRGYEDAQYKWLEKIEDLPEEYSYLNNYVIATFFQDRKDRTKYHVMLVSKETFISEKTTGEVLTTNKELLLDAKEREKLELLLISRPQVKYAGIRI